LSTKLFLKEYSAFEPLHECALKNRRSFFNVIVSRISPHVKLLELDAMTTSSSATESSSAMTFRFKLNCSGTHYCNENICQRGLNFEQRTDSTPLLLAMSFSTLHGGRQERGLRCYPMWHSREDSLHENPGPLSGWPVIDLA
jgi:hypothetical protein